jgi:hypothetical protein
MSHAAFYLARASCNGLEHSQFQQRSWVSSLEKALLNHPTPEKEKGIFFTFPTLNHL